MTERQVPERGEAAPSEFGSLVTTRTLSRNTGRVVEDIAASGRGKAVSHKGRIVAIIQPIDEQQLLDEILERDDFVVQRRRGLEDLEAGNVYSQAQADTRRASRRRSTASD